ncbi:DUF6282 family protein [Mycobacterium sp. NPDC003449]
MSRPAGARSAVTGLVDFHVHAGPDVRPRLMTWRRLAEDARNVGLAGFVAKSHHVVTVDVAALMQEVVPEIRVWGGVALNRSVGGINPHVVAAALAMGGRIVWLPTHDAVDGPSGPPLPVLTDRGALRDEVVEVIDQVIAADAVLCTGHLGQREVLAVAEYARRREGKVVVTHPEHRVNHIEVAAQKELSASGVALERLVSRAHSVTDLAGTAARIREVGCESSILGSDLGQPDQPHPLDGFADLVTGLGAHGFSVAEIRHMARELPLSMLGEIGPAAVPR